MSITIPKELVMMIDDIIKKRGVYRSKFISAIPREKVVSERNRHVKDAYDRVFSDESIRQEQLDCGRWFEGLGSEKGQEW